MKKVLTKDVNFLSSDTKTQIVGRFYSPEKAKRIMVIVHGMAEHMDRYRDFANYLAQNDTAVFTYNHLGHKATSKNKEELGFIAEKDGDKLLVGDCIKAVSLAAELCPHVPLILFGHSMGSFVVRLAAGQLKGALSALIISGTGGANPAAGVGLWLTKTLSHKNQGRFVSPLVNNMAFGSYNKRFEKRTAFDWLSRDEEVVDRYIEDEYSGFDFTVSAMGNLIQIIKDSNEKSRFASLDKDLPILLLSGEMDPVGNYAKGVREVQKNLIDAGMKNVTLKLFEGARHETLNETNKEEVYAYILKFIEEK